MATPRYDEVHLARLFARTRQDRIRSVMAETKNRWLVWNGVVWKPDTRGEHRELVKAFLDEAEEKVLITLRAVADDEAQADAKKQLGAVRRKMTRAGVTNIADLASTDPVITVELADLDTHPEVFATANGYINLRTGERMDPDPDLLMTKQSPVDYNPDAVPTMDRIHAAGRFQTFLKEITCGDAELESYLQKVAGYLLTGHVREQQIFILHGEGKNGKDTFVDALRHVMGDYGIKAPPDLLVWSPNGQQHSNRIRELAGARLAQSTEFERGQRLSEGLVKDLTGSATLKARALYREFEEFPNVTKHVLTTNHPPVIHGDDPAMQRRVRVIPFKLHLEQHEIDTELGEKLQAEAPVVLAWAIEGAVRYFKEGLEPPKAVIDATQRYIRDMDDLGRFLAENVVDDSDGFVPFADIWNAYTRFCDHEGVKRQTRKALGERLTNLGYETVAQRVNGKVVKGRRGARLTDQAQESDEFAGTIEDLMAKEVVNR